MKGAEDIESFLIQMEAAYEAVGENIWVVHNAEPDIVLSIAGPVLVFRMRIMDMKKVQDSKREEMYRMLLELNSGEMLHGSYGLEGGSVVMTDALQLENLDFNEFQATMDDMGLAVSNHYSTLSKLAA